MRKFVAVVMCGIIAAPVNADNCRRVVAVQQHAYVAPAFVDYGQNVVLVPKAFAVQTPLQSYTSVGDEYRQAYFASLVAQEYAKIVELQRQQLNPTGPAPSTSAATGYPPNAQASTAKPNIKNILATHCASCHSPANPKRVDLSGNPDLIPELVRHKSVTFIADGSMPMGKPALPQDDYNAVVAWAKEPPAKAPVLTLPVGPPAPEKPAASAGK